MLAVIAACGLGDKAALEDQITSAPSLFDATMVSGVVTVESRLVAAPSGGFGGFGGFGAPATGDAPELPEDGVPFGETQLGFTLDLGSSRASLAPVDSDAPFVFLEDLVSYGRRGGVPADDARPWVRLDLEDVSTGSGELDPFGEDTVGAIVSLHPAIVLDLVSGTLTGSIETVGPETVNGIETTHYTVNVAIDKAFGDVRRGRYPEDRRELVADLFMLLGIDGNVHHGDVWLDATGQVRRFRVALTQKPVTKVEFDLIVTLDITDIGGTYSAALPEPQEVLSVDTVLRFIRTVRNTVTADEEVPPGLGDTAVTTTVPAETEADA
jgi:hypothetical protein